jgi:CheY-like chemotaxis protein/DNA-directed RNA polymerase specialized sigma24 family protein
MSVAEQVVTHLPYLRRYARALSGNQSAGDAYVVALLELLVSDPSAMDRKLPSRVALYKLFTRFWNSAPVNSTSASSESRAPEHRLEALTPISRQAFLLSTMENFEDREIAAVLDRSEQDVGGLLSAAHKEVTAQVATSVLIIEDEPLIAIDLEGLMEELGHTIIGNARTHAEAIDLARGRNVGLILADIQLADGSSGMDAVNELLQTTQAPVIFITAYPERLLTGRRAEPTYLVTKPFKPSLVAGLASQALFFGEKASNNAGEA